MLNGVQLAQSAAANTITNKYESIERLPAQFSELPVEAKVIVKEVLNRLSEVGLDEASANAAAWGAVETNFQKLDNGTWIKKEGNPQFSDKRKGVLLPFRLRNEFEGAAQSWIQIFKKGKFSHPLYGEFEIDDKLLNNIVKNFETFQDRDIMVDYNHGSGTAADPESTKAAGWLRDLRVKKDGLYGLIDWTSPAVSYIKNGEFRYISPEWTDQYQDKRNGELVGPMLLAIALTNRPFLEGMAPVQLSEIPLHAKIKTHGGEPMKLVEDLKKRFGLAEDAADETVVKAIEQLESDSKSLSAAREEAAAANKKAAELLSGNEGLTKQLNEIKATAFADKIILHEKKALPAQRDEIVKMCSAMGVDSAANFWKSMPVLGHFKSHGANSDDTDGAQSLNEHEAHVAKMIGIDPKKVVAIKQKDASKHA